MDIIYRSDFSSVIRLVGRWRFNLSLSFWIVFSTAVVQHHSGAKTDLCCGIIYSCLCGQRSSRLWWSDTLKYITAVASTGRISHIESTYSKAEGLLAIITLIQTWPELWRVNAKLHIVAELYFPMRGEHGAFSNISNKRFSLPLGQDCDHL